MNGARVSQQRAGVPFFSQGKSQPHDAPRHPTPDFLLLPAGIFFAAFFLLPMARLFFIGGSGKTGWSAYAAILTDKNYLNSLIATLGVATATTFATLVISGISGVFLQRHKFPGNAALVAMLTFPLAFPGVVIGFMVIMLAGRQA